MKKLIRFAIRVSLIALAVGAVQQVSRAQILLDADTPATGSLLGSTPLLTPYGAITFVGQIRDRDNDPEFNAAGAAGNVFDIDDFSSTATLNFGFDVTSLTFIYGGNIGVFDVRARDINGVTVASFYQPDTGAGQPAGPITLSAAGIRSLFWQDPIMSFAAIDNLTLTVVPEPSALTFAVPVAAALLISRRRK